MSLHEWGLETPLTNISEKKITISKNLRRLEIGELHGLPSKVVTLYTSLNSLLSLTLDLNDLSTGYLTVLYEKPVTYFPQLEELTIMGLNDDNRDNLKEIVKKRAEVGMRPKKLVLCNQDDIGDRDLEWFKDQVDTLGLINYPGNEQFPIVT